MNTRRIPAIVIALIGLAAAAYVEYGTPRAAEVERSFGWFAYEAGPWIVVAVLAALSPFARSLIFVALAMLAMEVYAYYVVFRAPDGANAAIIYLFKPFYDLAVLAAGVLAGFLIARTREKPRRTAG